MKNIFFWLALIAGIVALIGSCAKKDESSSSSSASATSTSSSVTCTAVSSCSSTASGSFYVDNVTLSGVYDFFHIYGIIGGFGVDNSTGCVDNSSLITGRGPTGTQSLITQEVITSSTSFATKAVYYSDTACSSEIASMVIGYDNVSVGDNVTGLTTSIGNKTYPSSASEVTYKESCMEVKGTTDVGRDYLNGLISSSFVTTGQTHTCQGSGESKHALWAADNSTVSWESLHKEESSTAEYPGDWSSDTDSSTKLQSVTDIDGNVYNSVVIGSQTWMNRNLNVTKYKDGSTIPNPSGSWASLSTGAYGDYNNNATNSNTYGKLYNWFVVGDSRGICPDGWHVPTSAEFTVLTNELGVDTVLKMKEAGTDHWNSNTNATNDSGFTALPAGWRGTGVTYNGLRSFAYFWSSTTNTNSSSADFFELKSDDTVYRRSLSKAYGFSIRCLLGD